MFNDLKQKTSNALLIRRRRRWRQRFNQKLSRLWGEPLDLLDRLIKAAEDAGEAFDHEFRKEAVLSGDAVFDALTEMYSRACQVSAENFTLLSSGFADGAYARWRTLHEMDVVSRFISSSGDDVAERYLNHKIILNFKNESLLRDVEIKWGLDKKRISDADFERFKLLRDELIARYCKSYRGIYGWAAAKLNQEKPTFADIEKLVGLEYMRAQYAVASANLHPSAYGDSFRLGLDGIRTDFWHGECMLTGPSLLGLDLPGKLTAWSLNSIAQTLLSTRSSAHLSETARSIGQLSNEVVEAFSNIDRLLTTTSPR